jgi:hypothetical protein
MTEPDDPFRMDDAAYVLGILDLPDRRAFEVHLQSCDQCVAAVASLRDVTARLAGYQPSEVELLDPARSLDETAEMPDTLLPALLRDVGRARRRRRVGLAVAGATTLAACVAAIVILATGGRATAPRPTVAPVTPVAMSAVRVSPVHATATVRAVAWGTRIDLHCTYDNAHLPPGVSYDLVVIDRDNVAHQLGAWKLVPGQVTNYTAGTSLDRAQIAKLQVTTAHGLPVLQLAL